MKNMPFYNTQTGIGGVNPAPCMRAWIVNLIAGLQESVVPNIKKTPLAW